MEQKKTIAVLGAGSWGTALAILLAENQHKTLLWSHRKEAVESLQKEHRNLRYLPDYPFPEMLSVTGDLEATISAADIVLICVPSQAFTGFLAKIKPFIRPEMLVAWATKGLDPATGNLLHVSVSEILGSSTKMAVVSGPSFAKEVAAGLPTAITIASNDNQAAESAADLFRNPKFRVYTSNDVIGVQLGGAVKNVLAIATGAADGLGFGTNTIAAIMTRGLTEMMRLGIELGGDKETFMGLAGLGDIILTCTDNQSRNRRFGLGVGKGQSMQETTDSIGQEIEGIPTAKTVYQLAQKLSIDMPITEQVYKVIYEGVAPKDAVYSLLAREPKSESFV